MRDEYGGDGNDILRGGSGDDTVRGGNNIDTLISGSGADSFSRGVGTDLALDCGWSVQKSVVRYSKLA